jgi:hypothetical protein
MCVCVWFCVYQGLKVHIQRHCKGNKDTEKGCDEQEGGAAGGGASHDSSHVQPVQEARNDARPSNKKGKEPMELDHTHTMELGNSVDLVQRRSEQVPTRNDAGNTVVGMEGKRKLAGVQCNDGDVSQDVSCPNNNARVLQVPCQPCVCACVCVCTCVYVCKPLTPLYSYHRLARRNGC